MNQTELFYYVSNGVITDPSPKTVWAGSTQHTTNPFSKPYAVGAANLGADATDAELAALGVYRLYVTERGEAPAADYLPVTGELVVDAGLGIVTRTDSWRQMTAEEEALALPDAKSAAISANQSECTSRILAKWPLEKQSSAALGIYPQATTDEMATDIAAHITAENTAADLITAAASVAEVAAITVTWPE